MELSEREIYEIIKDNGLLTMPIDVFTQKYAVAKRALLFGIKYGIKLATSRGGKR